MKIKNIIKVQAAAAIAVVAALCCTSCNDDWNKHYDAGSVDSGTLWSAISAQSNVSNFANVVKACGYDAVLNGSSDHIADLRFGHDTCLGPLTVLMGLNGADKDPEDPFEVKNIYQNWQTCKASNLQMVFYRSKKAKDDILVKCLLNGSEVSLPLRTDCYPYYKWSDFKAYFTQRMASVVAN